MGCHFMRVVTSTPSYVAGHMVVRRGAPLAVDAALASELSNYLKVNVDAPVKLVESERSMGARVGRFFEIFNGDFHRNDGRLVHFCRQGSTSTCGSE